MSGLTGSTNVSSVGGFEVNNPDGQLPLEENTDTGAPSAVKQIIGLIALCTKGVGDGVLPRRGNILDDADVAILFF